MSCVCLAETDMLVTREVVRAFREVYGGQSFGQMGFHHVVIVCKLTYLYLPSSDTHGRSYACVT